VGQSPLSDGVAGDANDDRPGWTLAVLPVAIVLVTAAGIVAVFAGHAGVGVLLGAGGVAAALAVGAALLVDRILVEPVRALSAFVRQVSRERGDARAPIAGPKEIRALGAAMNLMVDELSVGRQQLTLKERLSKEMEIATRIQTMILPRTLRAEGLEIAAAMRPAAEVGGDYYDVMPVHDGCWLGIGDVAGHGLTAGLIMIMLQSAISTLVRVAPDAGPKTLVVTTNRVLRDNIRNRLALDEHVTLSLVRYHLDGRCVLAGAHEELLLCRARTGRCERIATPGTWLGVLDDISPFTVETTYQLEPGDVLVLYTDGATEARNARGEQFGIERLEAAVERLRERRAAEIVEGLLHAVASWCFEQQDDVTLLVARRR
jgi:serine phosphatase RsbU (regulator of sigma subunit)